MRVLAPFASAPYLREIFHECYTRVDEGAGVADRPFSLSLRNSPGMISIFVPSGLLKKRNSSGIVRRTADVMNKID